jgi:hypothetical protein
VRRFLSIALVLLLGMPLFASFVAAQGQSANLPACCRRNGAHRCMEMATMAASYAQPRVHAICPALPRNQASVQTGVWSHSSVQQSATRLDARPAAVAQAEAGYRIAATRSCHKRGPPARNS